jgi:hypothetical protein
MAERKRYLTKNVFVAGSPPEVTYNPRDDRHLESEVESYLGEGPGKTLTLSGPTKSGKTVLVERLLPRDEAIWIEGTDLATVDVFFNQIIDWLGVYDLVEVSREDTEGSGKQLGMTVGSSNLASINAGKKDDTSSKKGLRKTRTKATTSVAREALEAVGTPVVIDDFHYVAEDAKRGVAQAIKTIIPYCKVVLIAVPHEAFEVVRAEPDMGGRVWRMGIDTWSEDELEFIALRGFEALSIDDQHGVGKLLAHNSDGAPFLMQDLCYHYATRLGVLQTSDKPVTTVEPPSWDDFFERIANRMAPPIFDTLLRGPKERGQKRQARVFKSGKRTDVYGALLHGIAQVGKPAITPVQLMTILERDFVDTPSGQTVALSLNHMATLAMTNRGTGDSALAFKNDVLNILDPFFLFYLRYGSWTVEKQMDEQADQAPLPDLES